MLIPLWVLLRKLCVKQHELIWVTFKDYLFQMKIMSEITNKRENYEDIITICQRANSQRLF